MEGRGLFVLLALALLTPSDVYPVRRLPGLRGLDLDADLRPT